MIKKVEDRKCWIENRDLQSPILESFTQTLSQNRVSASRRASRERFLPEFILSLVEGIEMTTVALADWLLFVLCFASFASSTVNFILQNLRQMRKFFADRSYQKGEFPRQVR